MLKWLFLDLGWTLVDEAPAHRDRWRTASKLLSAWNRVLSPDDLHALAEAAATNFAPSPFRAVVDGLGLTASQKETLLEKAPYPKDKEVLYAGAVAVLDRLYPLFKLAVVANQSPGTERRLQSWGIRNYFSIVAASAEMGLPKPDQGIFLRAMGAAGCTPIEAAFVGDRLDNDIGPAKRLGCNTIRVLQGMHRLQTPRTADEVPDLTLDSLEQLPRALDSFRA